MIDDFYMLDLSDDGCWLIKRKNGERFRAGYDKERVKLLIDKLNNSHNPNVIQGDNFEIFVCWNNHEKDEKCEYVREL